MRVRKLWCCLLYGSITLNLLILTYVTLFPDNPSSLIIQNEMIQVDVSRKEFNQKVGWDQTEEYSLLISQEIDLLQTTGLNPLGKNGKEMAPKSIPCDDLLTSRPFYDQRGPYWVLYNYIQADRRFGCGESITISTHADWTYLDNLEPLLERWQGPISLSVYAPGSDYNATLARINYLRECTKSSLVRDFVTFHIVFDLNNIPETLEKPGINCEAVAPKFGQDLVTYRTLASLPYPVNVARNVAREMSSTYYVFPTDIELYPSPDLIPKFLEMIRRNESTFLHSPNPKVFVLSIFEVEGNVTRLPGDKGELVEMLGNGSAVPFHKYVCPPCHRLPRADEWAVQSAPKGHPLDVFTVGKRLGPFKYWEPIFIGSKFDPSYDERLSWDGRKDKMTQGYTLCVLDYEFHILDSAFLTHRPGIKRMGGAGKTASQKMVEAKQTEFITKVINPELKRIYGTRPGCVVSYETPI